MHQGLLHADHLFIDSTHVKASANKRKYDKGCTKTRAYEEKLQLELNMDREEHGKKPFPREV